MDDMKNPYAAACYQHCTDCVLACSRCSNHCLEMGGEHASVRHQRLMRDCASICAATAGFIARGSDHAAVVCRTCVELCRACAESCERHGDGDDLMNECGEACRHCATSCEEMAGASTR